MSRLEYLTEQFKTDSTYIDGKQCYTYTFNYDDFRELLNYITTLQEENEKLKKRDKTRNVFNEHITNIYKARNNKAIEYIKQKDEWVKNSDYKLLKTEKLLNILQGDDKE